MGGINEYAVFLEDADGPDAIEQLQQHDNVRLAFFLCVGTFGRALALG